MKLFYRATRAFFDLFFKLFYNHKVYGVFNIPEGACLIAANHASYYDPPLISASLNEEVYFLAKSSLFRNLFFQKIIKNLNAFPAIGKVEDLKAFKLISSLLRQHKKVIIFPEGFRSRDGQLSKVQTGTAAIAIRNSCPIIPTYLFGTFEIWPRKQKLPKIFNTKGTACIFGKPIYPESMVAGNKKQQQEALTKHLEASLNELKLWYENGAKGEPP